MNEMLKTLHELFDIYAESLSEAKNKLKKSGAPVSVGDAEYVDKLTHTVKSLKTTIAMMEAEDDGGYSGRYIPRMGGYYDPRIGMSYAEDGRGGMMSSPNRGSNEGGMSNAHGRRNAPRDSMGRYSGNDGYSYAAEMDSVMRDLEGMMDDMPADKQRRVQQLMDELRR